MRPTMGQLMESLKVFASDSALMARAFGRPTGTMGSSVSCTFGQLLSSAEIEEVRGALVLGVEPGVRC